MLAMFDGALELQFFAVSALHDVDDHHDEDDEIEGGFRHGGHFKPKQVNVSEVAAFRDQQNADDKQDEEANDLIHSVFLNEGRDLVC